MNRVLITGKNSELALDSFQRTASSNLPGSSHAQPTGEAVFYSGKTPESEAGGTRHHTAVPISKRRVPSSLQPNESGLGACFWRDCIVMFVAGCLTVAALVLVLL